MTALQGRWADLLRHGNRGLLVVAHPDDETLWCGGLLIRHWVLWDVVCCSIPRRDPIRAWKFHDAVRVLRPDADARVMPFEEPDPRVSVPPPVALDLERYDVIVTHGPRGEYGHAHHIYIGNEIARTAPERTIRIGTHRDGLGEYVLDLNEEERQRKLRALRCYDHQSPSDHGKPKWQALLDVYGADFDIGVESYDLAVR